MQTMQPPSETEIPSETLQLALGHDFSTPETWRKRFRSLRYLKAKGPWEVCSRLQELGRRWLEPQHRSKEQILELVVLEQFLAILPREMQSWEWGPGVETCAEALALAEGYQLQQKEDEKLRVTVSVKVKEVSDKMQSTAALQEPGASCPEQPKTCCVERLLDESGERETPGPGDRPPHVRREEPLPHQEPDSLVTEATWEPWYPRRGPSPGPGAATPRRGEQKPPGEEPITLELQRTSPGRLEERGSLTPEPGQVQLQALFEAVAVYFTQKEWELLEDEDKLLYRDQMLKIYQTLVSLGYQGPTPDLVCSIQQGQVELWGCDDEDGGEISRSEDLLPGGAWLLSTAEEQAPAEGSVNLEPPRTSPGSLGEMDSLRPEKEQWHKSQQVPKKQKENVAVNQHQRFYLRKKTHRCTECKKIFSCWQDLSQHQCVQSGEQPRHVTKRRKTFRKTSKLARHWCMHTREKPHQCLDCGKSFNLSSSLTKHRLIHTGEKPHRWSECRKRFTRSSDLAQHQRIHTGEKPHQCSVCGKSFIWSSHLTRHQLIHTGEKPHRCSQCGKTFNRSSNLAEHQRIHTGEKPHQCCVCGKSFTRSSKLAEHQRIHTGEKPHQCSVCGKSFSLASNLTRHRLTHTRKKPHQCSVCGKNFTRSSCLAEH
ncbi:zinc finger protein 773-like [Alligator sinensis]|uniref:Zinc finger protein 773-like n=1 Tax=Alligator sinensis TaxID=38654 RepID=A0A1U8DXS8_ALLSI|nr:zinc finger protein 773-like [Alligator sinensis]